MSVERVLGRSCGEPSPTGKAFIRLCDKYRREHPRESGIPSSLIDQYWRIAAEETGNQELLDAQNKIEKQKSQQNA